MDERVRARLAELQSVGRESFARAEPSFNDLMRDLKVCHACRALVLAANVDEHKQWHDDQITFTEDYVRARLGPEQ